MHVGLLGRSKTVPPSVFMSSEKPDVGESQQTRLAADTPDSGPYLEACSTPNRVAIQKGPFCCTVNHGLSAGLVAPNSGRPVD